MAAWYEAFDLPVPSSDEFAAQSETVATGKATLREEMLAELTGGPAGLKKWNARSERERWQVGKLRKMDFTAAKLNAIQLDNQDLQGTKFDRAGLKKATFCNSQLQDASFVHADDAKYDKLNWTPPTTPVPNVEVVCLGVVKKVAVGSFAMFEFRLRAIAESGPIATGQRLSWSAVFPIKPGVDIPAEGYLHLPQKQKFKPTAFLEKKVVSIRNATVSLDESSGRRLSLTEQSTVATGSPFAEWDRFLQWSPEPAIERLQHYKASPLDLETELQDEVVLRDNSIGPKEAGLEVGQSIHPIGAGRSPDTRRSTTSTMPSSRAAAKETPRKKGFACEVRWKWPGSARGSGRSRRSSAACRSSTISMHKFKRSIWAKC